MAAVPNLLFVDGRWIDSEDGATFDVVDPSTGEVMCAVTDATPDDGRRALDAAAAAQAAFARISPRARADILTRRGRAAA